MIIPPKTLKNKVLDRNGGFAIQARSNQYVTEIDADKQQQLQVQVLDVFQNFITNERRTTRNYIATLSIFFTGIIILIIAAALFVGMTFNEQLRDDVLAMNIDKGLADKARDRNHTAIKTLLHDTNKLKQYANKNNTDLASAMALSRSVDSQMGKVNEIVRMLEVENSSLKTNLANMRTSQSNISEYVHNVLIKMTDKQRAIPLQQQYTTPIATITMASDKTQPSVDCITSLITPRNTGLATEWLFSIPE